MLIKSEIATLYASQHLSCYNIQKTRKSINLATRKTKTGATCSKNMLHAL